MCQHADFVYDDFAQLHIVAVAIAADIAQHRSVAGVARAGYRWLDTAESWNRLLGCWETIYRWLDIGASLRASFYIYNSRDEVDALVDALGTARLLYQRKTA